MSKKDNLVKQQFEFNSLNLSLNFLWWLIAEQIRNETDWLTSELGTKLGFEKLKGN